ncbi:MAG TPA: aspartyl/asparaginyl beta-hydroxylase domain-containing protein [Flavobacteriales bacterium]|nr:aspartyl/asparaginyl beta-hydroxylase domain-containing protein [Flavobacteriales bacterium]
MSGKQKIWYSHKNKAYTGHFPAYFIPAEFPWVAQLEAKFPEIETEVTRYLKTHADELKPYFNKDLVSKKNAWQLLTLKFWGVENKKTVAGFPVLSNAINAIPHTVTCSISLMEPQTTIVPHIGDTDAVMRCHLGLDVPAGLPACGIKVNDVDKAWERGKVLIFCDAYMHSAWNHTDQRRIVIIFDVVHDVFKDRYKNICNETHALLWLQKKRQDSPFFNKLPGPVLGILMRLRKLRYALFGIRELNL